MPNLSQVIDNLLLTTALLNGGWVPETTRSTAWKNAITLQSKVCLFVFKVLEIISSP